MTDSFKDFDAIAAELGEEPDRPVTFQLADQTWEANLTINAGAMLRWMRTGSKVEGIPALLDALMGEKQVIKLEDALIEKGLDFSIMEKVILWLAEQMGDSGN